MDIILEFNYILIRKHYICIRFVIDATKLIKTYRDNKMKLKTILATMLLATSFSASAWGPFNGNGYNNAYGNGNGSANFGFNMKANAQGNGNGSSNNGYASNNTNGYGSNNANGNFIGNGNFGFNMNANAQGNGNGWGNNGYGYNSGHNPHYAPAMSQDQIEAQRKAQAAYYKQAEEKRQAFIAAQKKAHEEYVAMMNKRYNVK